MDWGAFIWKVMLFGVKNGPSAFQRALTKTFKKYLDIFMKIYLDDFIVYNDMGNSFIKALIMFTKEQEIQH